LATGELARRFPFHNELYALGEISVKFEKTALGRRLIIDRHDRPGPAQDFDVAGAVSAERLADRNAPDAEDRREKSGWRRQLKPLAWHSLS